VTGTCAVFEADGAVAVGGMKFKFLEAAPLSVYRMVSLRIH
jgi:hypothetical protein